MNSESPAETHLPTKPSVAKHWYFPNKLGCIFATLALVVSAMLSYQNGSRVGYKGLQAKALAQAKEIGLALRLYAEDHGGQYPTAVGDPASEHPTGTATNANAAFANLFPTYLTTEKMFYVRGSTYCNPEPPDEVYNTKETCLAPGENGYGYVAGLTDKGDAALPLVVCGTDGTGHYVSDGTKRGGLWEGKGTIVVHLDNSVELERLTGPGNKRFIPRSKDDNTHNLLDPAYLKTFDAYLLDPATGEGRR